VLTRNAETPVLTMFVGAWALIIGIIGVVLAPEITPDVSPTQ
jgi:hypothetical protein